MNKHYRFPTGRGGAVAVHALKRRDGGGADIQLIGGDGAVAGRLFSCPVHLCYLILTDL